MNKNLDYIGFVMERDKIKKYKRLARKNDLNFSQYIRRSLDVAEPFINGASMDLPKIPADERDDLEV